MGRISQECVEEWTGLVKCFGRRCSDWPEVFAGVGWIGQECLEEWEGLVSW